MNQSEVKAFLNKHINLDSQRYQQINKIYKQTKEDFESKSIKLTKQGSIATKTAIRPKNPNHDYDVDIAVHTEDINGASQYIEHKDILEYELTTMYNSNDVQRKNKCINVKFNEQFNADFVTMKNDGKHQWIFDESNDQEIYSDNLNLVEIINDKFATSENNSLGDCAKLLKFYLRQHSNTSDLLPSIVQNLLIISHAASKSSGYIGQIATTLSNITKIFNDNYKNETCITFVPNPSNGEEIETNIDSISQMKDIILVIQDLKFDILDGGLRALKIDSEIRSHVIYSSSHAKPWKE